MYELFRLVVTSIYSQLDDLWTVRYSKVGYTGVLVTRMFQMGVTMVRMWGEMERGKERMSMHSVMMISFLNPGSVS